MDDLYKLRQYDKHTAVVFQTPSLMNQTEVERIRGDVLRLVDQEKRTHLVLDFDKVEYISSAVLGLILSLNKKLTALGAGGSLTLCGLGPKLIELLKISRLDRLLTIKPTRKEAIAT